MQIRHWKAIEDLVILLEPFVEYTALGGGEDYTTISCVVPILMELKLHIEKVSLYTSKLYVYHTLNELHTSKMSL